MNFAPRKLTRAIHVGPVQIGGGAPVAVQSMTNTDTRDVAGTLAQMREYLSPETMARRFFEAYQHVLQTVPRHAP